MLGNVGVYAVKRRKKPAQKNASHPPVKTNPSKRHRDRLNMELERLTGLLPFSEEVRGRLDKLSVLRLSVGYLKVKTYFHDGLHSKSAARPPDDQAVTLDGVRFSEGEFLLKSLSGFVLVVTRDGTIFYTSPTMQDFLGFHQSDVVQQSILDLVHVDDRELFSCQLQPGVQLGDATPMLPMDDSFFLERSFCCRLRCLLDNTSGFLALKFSGHLKYLKEAATAGKGNPPLALFAIATPLQPPSVMEIRTKTLIFQTKHRMDFAPMAVDTRGKLVLGFSETELIMPGSGYQFLHAADMIYCADNHVRMMKTGDSGFTFFRLLTKSRQWLWVQASARVVFKDGRPDFIIARQKPLSNEEGEEHFQKRRQQLPFNVTTGEGVLYDLDPFTFPAPEEPPLDPGSILDPFTIPAPEEPPLDPGSILGSLRRQDRSLYSRPQHPGPRLPVFPAPDDPDPDQPQQPLEMAFLDSRALLSVPGQARSPRDVGDLTSRVMLDSLEQILGDIGGGFLEGLEVDQRELRDWESTILRMNEERELNDILANDVFSYVEEALLRETGGDLKVPSDSSRQTLTHLDRGREPLCHPDMSLGHIWPASEGAYQGAPGLSRNLETLDVTHQTWLPTAANSTFHHTDSHSHSPASWPLRHHHTPASGSCVFERGPGPQVGANPAFAHPQAAGGAWNPAAGETHAGAHCHASGEISGHPLENGLSPSAIFCWNGQAQIPKVPVNHYVLPARPAGGLNLSQEP
ncbi:aryl hydrocarbon receptor-like isoform X2 [Entelurus aequoreus]|uniref:aryl hydrocarbon receptor-like isoform X2 n=1 Tax=Entelurus aequoreus TaxID=161455 RepID=UPI002B1D4FB7|nr:aryl hydrocarbon receptor-like isoform X2 [Entelurus aequoreus]